MNLKQNFYTVLLAAFASAAIAPGYASTEETPPTANQGLEAVTLQTVDLGAEIEGMEGRALRLRKLTLAPGGHVGIHSHEDRPAVAYILQGTTTVTFGDGSVRRFSAGDSISATKDTTHWHRNDEQKDLVLVTTDVWNAAK